MSTSKPALHFSSSEQKIFVSATTFAVILKIGLPGWTAHTAGTVKLHKSQPLRRHFVQVGWAWGRVAIDTEVSPAKLTWRNE